MFVYVCRIDFNFHVLLNKPMYIMVIREYPNCIYNLV
jgi:hypothetical protein